ncbi:MAG: septation protein IspZ [Planctomycetota bacterium]
MADSLVAHLTHKQRRLLSQYLVGLTDEMRAGHDAGLLATLRKELMTDPAKLRAPTWLRPVIEFAPLLVFFVLQRTTTRMEGLYWATIGLMIATATAVGLSRWFERRWPVVPLITLVIVGGLGGTTLPRRGWFIKFKPSLVYGGVRRCIARQPAHRAPAPAQRDGPGPAHGGCWLARPESASGLFCLGLVLTNEILRRVLDTGTWTTVKTRLQRRILRFSDDAGLP